MALRARVAHGETTVNAAIDIEAFDGTRKNHQTSAVPIRDADERITGAVVVNEDISDRKTAERETDRFVQSDAHAPHGLMQAQDDERRRIAQMLTKRRSGSCRVEDVSRPDESAIGY